MSTKHNYFKLAVTCERLHRMFLEIVRRELSRLQIRDINSAQCLILYQAAHENNKLTINEFTTRGYYMGSNISYNISKMVRNGYFIQCENTDDKRSSYIKLSKKGLELYEKLDELFKDHSFDLEQSGTDNKDFTKLYNILNEIENFMEVIKNG